MPKRKSIKSIKADKAKLPRVVQELILQYAAYQPPGPVTLEDDACRDALLAPVAAGLLISTSSAGTVAGVLAGLALIPWVPVIGIGNGLSNLSMFAKEKSGRSRAFSEAEKIFDADLLRQDFSKGP